MITSKEFIDKYKEYIADQTNQHKTYHKQINGRFNIFLMIVLYNKKFMMPIKNIKQSNLLIIDEYNEKLNITNFKFDIKINNVMDGHGNLKSITRMENFKFTSEIPLNDEKQITEYTTHYGDIYDIDTKRNIINIDDIIQDFHKVNRNPFNDDFNIFFEKTYTNTYHPFHFKQHIDKLLLKYKINLDNLNQL